MCTDAEGHVGFARVGGDVGHGEGVVSKFKADVEDEFEGVARACFWRGHEAIGESGVCVFVKDEVHATSKAVLGK